MMDPPWQIVEVLSLCSSMNTPSMSAGIKAKELRITCTARDNEPTTSGSIMLRVSTCQGKMAVLEESEDGLNGPPIILSNTDRRGRYIKKAKIDLHEG